MRVTGDPLPDDDHVARYCKPSSVDEHGMPMASAFQLRSGGAAPVGQYPLRIEHLPLNDDQSHAGIAGYTSDDLAVAVELKALLSRGDVHPAVPSPC